jgi:DNA-binding transcriptional ArsR family regulator
LKSRAKPARISPYDAIADPTRRAILDLLRDQESSTAGEIADRFRRLSRPAVSKHLRVLRRAGLVRAQESGREWHYRLEAEPLRTVYESWLAFFEPYWQGTLHRLKEHVEKKPRT